MRERRWESGESFEFREILETGKRLSGLGLKPFDPSRETIIYIEDWTVGSPGEISRLQAWSMEDVTLQHLRENWQGDFFILAGKHYDVFRRHQGLGHYCSISHPFRSHPFRAGSDLKHHHSRAMFWTGFRDQLSFIRLRLQTHEVITPGENRADSLRGEWTKERMDILQSASERLNLPVEISLKNNRVDIRNKKETGALFNSWPDAFGPCQVEFNNTDPNQSLIWGAQLADTWGNTPANVRTYLTGFDETALRDFERLGNGIRLVYRLSLHARLDELPQLLESIAPHGRLYATLGEFKTNEVFPNLADAWMVVGTVGSADGFRLEVRLNRAPLPENEMGGWLKTLFNHSFTYSPLPAFIA